MYCTRKVTDQLYWVGGNDRRLSLFEGVYAVPDGVSYNSYLLLDEKTVLFDTVDAAVSGVFFENIEHVLGGRPLDYLIIQHMEPDHSATVSELLLRYPDTTIVTNNKVLIMLKNFFPKQTFDKVQLVDETTEFSSGAHKFHFVMAPMVHWPEVMVTYDATDKTLFSADAFGTFGALNGALFADEVNFDRDYLDEARRYYTNIVGKYGIQVQNLLKKAAGLDIQRICPLHGFVWRENLGYFLEKYLLWSSYQPEKKGVMIAYASIYGNTANAADVLACRLRDRGIPTVMYDVSMKAPADIVSAAFTWSHLVFASSSYNGGVFVSMEQTLRELVSHNLQNRTVAFLDNGSWAAVAGKQMRQILEPCKNMTYLDEGFSMLSTLKESQSDAMDALADALAASVNA
ncbi:MAG: FprA family A-type flavoprotein [Oscillospiraceae bacterium]|nr:FprA family A-type flavoprotein [Oscillospiraceae bacterium]